MKSVLTFQYSNKLFYSQVCASRYFFSTLNLFAYEILLIKKLEIEKMMATKLYQFEKLNIVGLVFSISHFIINKIYQANRLSVILLNKSGFRILKKFENSWPLALNFFLSVSQNNFGTKYHFSIHLNQIWYYVGLGLLYQIIVKIWMQ